MGSGNIQLAGRGGDSGGANDLGVRVAGTGVVSTGEAGSVEFLGDSIDLAATAAVRGGTVTLRPLFAGVFIDLGGDDDDRPMIF